MSNYRIFKEKLTTNCVLYSGEHGDPMAVSKHGYVHKEMRSGETDPPTTQLSHFSFFCPGIEYDKGY